MERTNKKLIAVVGATGQQGGAVVRALQAGNQFNVRALTRNPARHSELADEVIQADLNRPETLTAAFEGAHGVFLVTNLWEEGTDELKQATAPVRAAKEAGFANHTFVIAPFYYQNLIGVLAPQKQADGSVGWALPLDPTVRSIHMGDITELGDIVAGAFANPDQAG